jgi:primosomal protein N' (replication factor Y)
LQTHQPEHPVMRALVAQDRDAFYSAEIDMRERTHYPPFGRLASLVVSGEDRHDTASYARALARAAPLNEDVRVLGPADAPLSLVRGRHRLRLLVKAPRGFDLSAYLREWLAEAPKVKGSIKLDVDVDPQSFL